MSGIGSIPGVKMGLLEKGLQIFENA